jgi:parallel beta-helix repeat protein
MGLSLFNCTDLEIKNNQILLNNNYGIFIEESSNCCFINNIIEDNDIYGLYILKSIDNIVEDNNFKSNGIFIKGDIIEHFIHTINGNMINGKEIQYYKNTYDPPFNPSIVGSVIWVNCEKGKIEGFDPLQGDVCIELAFCKDTEIEHSTFSNNDYGIYGFNSSGSIIKSCFFTECENGIYLVNCSNIQILNENIITNNNKQGIRLDYSTECLITNNNISKNREGIYLKGSSNNQILWNNLSENKNHGIILAYSSDNSHIKNNTIIGTSWTKSGGDGIKIQETDLCSITNNDIRFCYGEGIWLEEGINNYIENNNIYYNRGNGIQVVSASYNFIYGNYINFNRWGIRFDKYSSNNKIWRNKFINNGNRLNPNLLSGGGNAVDDGDNIWNGSYWSWKGLIGGNWWSDWQLIPLILTDDYQGEYQNISGCDGVIDQPYFIRDSSGNLINNTDYYPLVDNETWLPDKIPPKCEIRNPKKGFWYLNNEEGRSVALLERLGISVVIGDINITVYAEDKLFLGFSSDHVTVEFKIDGERVHLAEELDDNFECHWLAWDKTYFGLKNLEVISKDRRGNMETDELDIFIIHI